MRNLLTSLVLCSIAPFAAAQCAADSYPPVARVRAGGELIKTAGAATDTSTRRQATADDLIETAAGTREATNIPATAVVATQGKANATSGEQHRSGSGRVMLLTALAIMSAIALRRAGALG
jgi:hypothetical protein